MWNTRTNPSHKVVLHYVVETPRENSCSYVAERLYPVEPGIFVWEFTLFAESGRPGLSRKFRKTGTELAYSGPEFLEENEEKLVTGTKYADIYEMARILSERDLPELEEKIAGVRQKEFSGGDTFFPEIRS